MLVLGHRGAIIEGVYQNSRRAFEEALATADGFETDACIDKNGEVFLMHEALYADAAKGVDYCAAEHLDTASATLMGTRRIDELTTDEMRALRLKDGSPVPTLREAIALVGAQPGKILNIELKAYGAAESVLHLLANAFQKNTIRPDCVIISSFNHPALPAVRRRMPDLRIGAIVMDDALPPSPLFPWHPGSEGRYEPLNAKILESPALKQAQPDVFVMPESSLTAPTIDMIGAKFPSANLSGWVFTERGAFDFQGLLQRLKTLKPTGKIASIIVDNPRKYAAELRRI